MLQAQSWVNSEPREVAEQLAKKAVVLKKLGVEKRAVGATSGFLSDLGKKFQALSPEAQSTLLGAGLGGGAGLLSSAFADKEDRDTAGSTLTGALAGGAAGLGAGMVGRQLGITPSDLTQGKVSLPGFSDSGSNIKTIGGKKYNIPPEEIAKNPDLVKNIEDLTSESAVNRGGKQLLEAATWYPRNHPILSLLGLGDITTSLAAHGGPETTLDPEHLRKGVGALAGEGGKELRSRMGLGSGISDMKKVPNSTGNPQDINIRPEQDLRALAKSKPETLRKLLREARHLPDERIIWGDLTAKQFRQLAEAGAESEGITGLRSPANLRDNINKLTSWLSGGATNADDLAKKDPLMHTSGRYSGLNRFKQRQTIGLKPKTPGATGGLLGRLGLYAGIPALQYMLSETAADRQKKEELKRLMEKFTVKE